MMESSSRCNDSGGEGGGGCHLCRTKASESAIAAKVRELRFQLQIVAEASGHP